MVSLSAVQDSNSKIAATFGPGSVAVFVGATSGIGETSLKQFARHSQAPRIYFIGRSQEAGDRITGELQALNKAGTYIFVKADVSLIKVVDDVCRDIRSKEKAINLLFQSQGSLHFHAETAEGLPTVASLHFYSRNRFIVNLLPLIQQARSLRRVISVFAGTYEGPIYENDFMGRGVPMRKARGHMVSMITLFLGGVAKKAPDVTFIQAYPGAVEGGLLRDPEGVLMHVMKVVWKVVGPFITIPNLECGERHAFLATSSKYPASEGRDSGVSLEDGITVAQGTDGEIGSGVYSVDQFGESGPKVTAILSKFREEGMVERLWNHTEEEFKRITGMVAAI
ncbi:Oxidoreductase andH [Lachnellula cervina]|uniref:Oxidoreductase andH n=1 Tax=Lachnellula cervina TaxID=1316786 RepID=A0A7D8Z261_9HELO|nr:Oxidoreductase andH [Lachnellula cervina]